MPGILRLAERVLFVSGSLMLGLCAAVYFGAEIFQSSADKLFADAPHHDLIPPQELKLPGAEVLPAQVGSPISKLEIPRLGVSVVIVEGVRPRDLLLGVGHIPGTALPGESGNVGIAGHRDTFFRKLAEVRMHDTITLTTLRGSFEYSVESIQVVDPADTEVLQPSDEPILTLVTCYPFFYVGPAPRRFIVRAREETHVQSE